jgi:hypothetical protein
VPFGPQPVSISGWRAGPSRAERWWVRGSFARRAQVGARECCSLAAEAGGGRCRRGELARGGARRGLSRDGGAEGGSASAAVQLGRWWTSCSREVEARRTVLGFFGALRGRPSFLPVGRGTRKLPSMSRRVGSPAVSASRQASGGPFSLRRAPAIGRVRRSSV